MVKPDVFPGRKEAVIFFKLLLIGEIATIVWKSRLTVRNHVER